MGKGNRVRGERAQENLNRGHLTNTSKKKNWIIPVVAIVVAVLIIGSIVLATLSSNGTFLRSRKFIKSDHYTVTGTMMQYYTLENLNYYLSQLNLSSSSSSSTLISYYRQYYSQLAPLVAESRAQAYVELCEGAYAEGVKLDEDDVKQIDTVIDNYSVYAKNNGYANVNAYLAAAYGNGVRLKDIRAFLELQVLATKYQDILSKRFEEALTEDEINAFYEEHYTDYQKADTVSYKLEATLQAVNSTLEKDSAEYKAALAAAQEQFEKDCAAIRSQAETLAGKTTVDEFNAYIAEITAKTADTTEEAGEAGETSEGGESNTGEGEQTEETVKATENKGMTYTADNAVSKWLFGETFGSGAAANTTYVDESKSDNALTLTVYLVTSPAARDESTTHNIAILMCNATETPLADETAFIDAFKAGEMTRDAFVTLADEKITTSHTATKQDNASTIGITELDNWLASENAVPGAIGQMTTKQSGIDYRLVVFEESAGEQVWHVSVKDDAVTKKMSDWLEASEKTYNVVVDESVMEKIVIPNT